LNVKNGILEIMLEEWKKEIELENSMMIKK